MRGYVLRTPYRGFIAIPAAGEVTYLWSTGPDEVAMHTSYGKEMPGHCALYFSPRQATRRLSCLRLVTPEDVADAEATLVRLGSAAGGARRRCSGCSAPARRCTTTPAAKWRGSGCFGHGPDDRPILNEHHKGAWDLARRISMRLGYFPPVRRWRA